MSDSPDAIRADIERTRQEFGRDVDALADKVTPSKIMHRQTDRMKQGLRSVRERVMGAADDTGGAMRDAGSSVASAAGDLGHRAKAKAEGNPLAVGLMAFAAGLVIATLIPASDREKEIAEEAKEKAQPLLDEASEVARTVGEELKQPAQDAAAAIKDDVVDAAAHVKGDATQAAQTVADSAQQARDNVSGGS
ncbi:DUF3618 domain-containing protein [Microbacterium sp.]|uniref:DUF3618 domain-containing protein n=1 Tax=Microbacterium sp. TaxID=51671 RepID=UPI002811CE03|nr:DUF3618 domain-containing protein [Microbacterium sp.]